MTQAQAENGTVFENEVAMRYFRHESIIPHDTIAQQHPLVVGVGSVGHQLALQLANIGIMKMTIIDKDDVEIVNCGPQAYSPQHVGTPKVIATESDIDFLSPELKLQTINEFLDESTELLHENMIFCCADSMTAREQAWKLHQNSHSTLFVDARMTSNYIRILTNHKGQSSHTIQAYQDSLFPDEEALPERCTEKLTCYAAAIAAGFMVNQMVMALKGFTTSHDFSVNLLSLEISQCEHQQRGPSNGGTN